MIQVVVTTSTSIGNRVSLKYNDRARLYHDARFPQFVFSLIASIPARVGRHYGVYATDFGIEERLAGDGLSDDSFVPANRCLFSRIKKL